MQRSSAFLLPKDDPEKIGVAYGEIRARLEAAGKPIGGNEMLIASQAISLGLTIVTDNEREFSRVEARRFENWFR